MFMQHTSTEKNIQAMGLFDESFSSIEVAAILGVHRVTVASWIKQGALEAARTPGGRYLVSRNALRRFLTERGMAIPASLGPIRKKTVVAVDDDPRILEVLEGYFREIPLEPDWTLQTFLDPLDAALFIGSSRPDLVLLDIVMPNMDGHQLARKIKETSPETKIVVITGHATPSHMEKLEKAPIDGVLQKPFNLEEFRGVLEKHLSAA